MTPSLILAAGLLGVVLLLVWGKLVRARRAEFIREFSLPPGLYDKLRQKHPDLSLKDCQLVGHALRQFFLAYLKSGKEYISMPSQVVDDLWHEFILYTRNYAQFCRGAFGSFLHHTPAAVLGGKRKSNDGLRRCWWQVCREENINPRRPTRLPLLFALDRKLQIKNGFLYVIDCKNQVEREKVANRTLPVYCAGDLDWVGPCAVSNAFEDGSGENSHTSHGRHDSHGNHSNHGDATSFGDAGGHGHGCSGSGCSGGCSGGGD
jgi:hypothetical protein